MRNYYRTLLSSCCMMLMLLFSAQLTFAQEFKDGVRQGMVKVKFSQGMSQSLSSMRVTTNGDKLVTGIQSFDRVSDNYQTTAMRRLFPENSNPVLEAKLRKHDLHLWYILEADDSQSAIEIAAAYGKLDVIEVAEVEREKILSPYTVRKHSGAAPMSNSEMPFDDPMLPDQWHYENTGQTGFESTTGQLMDINLFEAWQSVTGSREVIVSIHDMGVDTEHPDLIDNLWVNEAELTGTEGVDDDGNGYIDDVHGWDFNFDKGDIKAGFHGTHVAGTVGAVNNNGIGVAGVAGGSGNNDGVRMMSVAILEGGSIENSFIYAADNGAVISQNSWGYRSPGEFDKSVQDAIDYFIEEAGDYEGSPMKGGIVIFASGNQGYDAEWYPGYYENVMAVASLTVDGRKAGYSTYGTWIDVSAPGGQSEDGTINMVLSTLPDNEYGYLDGTSMACPHVSGVAALALAKLDTKITPEILWTMLTTGTVGIDDINPNYAGKLGSGAIDAALAIQENDGIAPNKIIDLAVVGSAQELISVSWTVPSDEDDELPVNFLVVVNDGDITADNMNSVRSILIKNESNVGEEVSLTIDGLIGQTAYKVAVVSTDRWGNTSDLSNIVEATTDKGPAISVDENSAMITLDVDVSSGTTSASHDMTILNGDEGLLRWEYFTRHKSTSLSWNSITEGIRYPALKSVKTARHGNVSSRQVGDAPQKDDVQAYAFEQSEKSYTSYASYIIGETELDLTNSSATRFYVDEPDGFNMTRVRGYFKHDPAVGPIVMEIYKGAQMNRENLIHAQEHSNWSADYAETAYITLEEQLYFNYGETFWIVFHVPAGNLFPLGVGWEFEDDDSDNCFMSFDLGSSWTPLADAMEDDRFAWYTVAESQNEYLGEYITLMPGSGEIAAMESAMTTVTTEASTLINGTYNANVVLASNDPNNRELRVPVTLNVTGQKSDLTYTETIDFGSVFVGTTKTISVTLKNEGLGNYLVDTYDVSNAVFVKDWSNTTINAQGEVTFNITYSPTAAGNDNGFLTITSSKGEKTHKLVLFGVATPPTEIAISPLTQTVDNITIGDEVNATVTVENTGDAVLKYFVPGFEEDGFSDDWPVDYHSYGYKVRNSHDAVDPLVYDYQDISTTGTSLTDYYKAFSDEWSEPVELGFDFPFYKQTFDKIYIASKGFISFADHSRPVNNPRLGNNQWKPTSYVSVLGHWADYAAENAQAYYQVFPDRVIIQYNNLGDQWSGYNTAQMVLHANGNIRFYYESFAYFDTRYANVLIEDIEMSDGVLLTGWDLPLEDNAQITSGSALGFDYPGPDIITAMTNASGLLLPGETADMELTMNTATISEGLINRYVNVISNDPFNGQQVALVELNVTAGGTSDIAISTASMDFGSVYQGANVSKSFIIKNNGTAAHGVTSMAFDNDAFTVTGNTTTSVGPGLGELYHITLPTTTVGAVTDNLTITHAGGTHVIALTGEVVDAPAINVDLSEMTESLAFGETSSQSFSIENTGAADLEVVATANQWATMEPVAGPSSTPEYTYTFTENNDGTEYQWLDIMESGEQMSWPDFNDYFNPEEWWRPYDLPRPITFYGKEYSKMWLGQAGIITFDEPTFAPLFTEEIPTSDNFKTLLAPYFTFGGFQPGFWPEDETGIFVQVEDDKIIVSWEYLVNNFGGMGDPPSAQVIFYNNGTMKFQYKVNGSFDATSNFTIIGMQNEDRTDGVVLSQFANLPHGDGLAYIVMPAEKHTVSAGGTLDATINFDASTKYSGTYTDMLKIRTNVPNQELLEKPLTLTITGEAAIEVPASIDFGDVMVYTDAEGNGTSLTQEFEIKNTGTAVLAMNGMNVESFSPEYMIEMYQYDSWFGWWFWGDVAWIWQWPSINPGESLQFRITYTPSAAGDIADNIVVNHALGQTLIPITATAVLPPRLAVNTATVESYVESTTGTDTQVANIDNVEGQSDLTYSLSIQYGRSTSTTTASSEVMATGASRPALQRIAAGTSGVVASSATENFNKVLQHEEADAADNFLGFNGAYDFPVATRFNAGSEGFTVSHIQVFYRAPEVTSGSVKYEVRAGGADVSEAAILTTGTFDYEYANGDDGEWLTIEVAEPQTIYPNEDFYLVVEYNSDLAYPQAVVEGLENVENRFMYRVEGVWYDLQPDFSGNGWMMRAAELEYVSNTWVAINGETTGSVAAGESADITLDFTAAYGTRGDQEAILIVESNDPDNPRAEIPVNLRVNDAPEFEMPSGIESVMEGTDKTIEIAVEDKEGHTFTITTAEVYGSMTHEYADGVLSVSVSPGYNDAGMNHYVFVAEDEMGASREVMLTVEVLNNNRAPVFVSQYTQIDYYGPDYMHEFDLSEWFIDEDGDEISYEIVLSQDGIIDVYQDNGGFIIKTAAMGTVEMTLTATDTYGASTTEMVTIVVNDVLSVEDGLAEGISVFPNPVKDQLTVSLSAEHRGAVNMRILDTAGREVMAQQIDNSENEVSVQVGQLERGIYILKLISNGVESSMKLIKQ